MSPSPQMVNCRCGGSYVVAALTRQLKGRKPHPPDVTPKCPRRYPCSVVNVPFCTAFLTSEVKGLKL